MVLVDIRKTLSIEQIPIARERQCEALSCTSRIMLIPPVVWSKNCYRQGSWFRTSRDSNNFLIVSSVPLFVTNYVKAGIIKKIILKTCPIVSKDQWIKLLENKTFMDRAPEEWFHLLEREIPVFQGFIERNQMNVSLQELLKMQSANHANFLLSKDEVLITTEFERENLPCSLFPQNFSCSACLELFGVLGDHLPKKIIKKCPGLKYLNLLENEFLLATLR